MADNEQQNIIETDPEKVVEEEKTSFLKQIKDTAKNSAKELKKNAEIYKDKAEEIIDNAQDYAVKHQKRVSKFLNNILMVTFGVIIYGIHASALCYLSMSVNVNGGLGGVNLNGPPFKPSRFAVNKCPDTNQKGFAETIRNSLKVFGFPYRNIYSCDMFSMLKESFITVRFARWASNSVAFSYSTGRGLLNGIFSFFSDPILAFWIFPLIVPLITTATVFFAPITTVFSGIMNYGDITPTNFFGMIAMHPYSTMFTFFVFMLGLFAVPLTNTFAMMGCVTFFFLIFPYLLNDKFIFPDDKKRKVYKGFDFIWANFKYRWEGIVLAWIIAIANTARISLDTTDDLKAKVIGVDNKNLEAKVMYNSGSYDIVKLKDIEIDNDSYLKINGRVKILGGENRGEYGVIKNVDIMKEEKIFTIFIEDKRKSNKLMKTNRANIEPVIAEKSKQNIRSGTRIIVNSKSTVGSTVEKYIYLVALCWLIWIIFRHKATYVVLSALLFILNFLKDNQFIIALIILVVVGLYFTFSYKDELKDVVGKLADKAEEAANTVADNAEGVANTVAENINEDDEINENE